MLVWKTILPLGMKSNKFGKLSPSWEGLYNIVTVIFENSYMVEKLQVVYPEPIMEDILKKYYPACGKTLEDKDGRYSSVALSIIF